MSKCHLAIMRPTKGLVYLKSKPNRECGNPVYPYFTDEDIKAQGQLVHSMELDVTKPTSFRCCVLINCVTLLPLSLCQWQGWMDTNTHTYMKKSHHTHTHTTLSYTYSYTLIHSHTHIHTHTDSVLHIHAHLHTHPHLHMLSHTHSNTLHT